MKRMMQFAVITAMTLAAVSIAVAQSNPEPVVRMGDWVEVGDDVFVNLISINSIRYHTGHNFDFENDIQDTLPSSNANSSSARNGRLDGLEAEIRFGADWRYKKNLQMRILFEAQSIFDGNLIDDRTNQTDGTQNNPHVERFWIDYRFPGTPLRTRIGAYLWCLDIACLVSDDDPGTHFFLELGDLEIHAAFIIQREGQRLGLTNDNDNVDYLLSAKYKTGGHTFGLSLQYERDRFTRPQQQDTVLIMPGWQGKIGPVKAFGQFNLQVGSLDANTGDPTTDIDYDVFSWSVIAGAELQLGKFRPVIGFIYASGDDDPNDRDLGGFAHQGHRDVSLISLGPYPTFDSGMYDVNAPCVGNSPLCGGATGYHTVTNPFADRIGNTAHLGVNSTFSNPGVITATIGTSYTPIKGHRFQAWYVYVGLADVELVETAAGRDIDRSLLHEFGGRWTWTLNKHLNINVRGNIYLPGEGMEDIAETLTVCGDSGTATCGADNVALGGELMVRASF